MPDLIKCKFIEQSLHFKKSMEVCLNHYYSNKCDTVDKIICDSFTKLLFLEPQTR